MSPSDLAPVIALGLALTLVALWHIPPAWRSLRERLLQRLRRPRRFYSEEYTRKRTNAITQVPLRGAFATAYALVAVATPRAFRRGDIFRYASRLYLVTSTRLVLTRWPLRAALDLREVKDGTMYVHEAFYHALVHGKSSLVESRRPFSPNCVLHIFARSRVPYPPIMMLVSRVEMHSSQEGAIWYRLHLEMVCTQTDAPAPARKRRVAALDECD